MTTSHDREHYAKMHGGWFSTTLLSSNLRDWGYEAEQMDYWRWHIINELAKDKLLKAEERPES